MAKATETSKVLLRDLDSQRTTAFEADHAERILGLPGTRWEKVSDDDAKKSDAAPKRAAAAASDSVNP